MSPPLRREDDRLAVVEALADGTIDVIVSDHNPQDVEVKRLPFAEAANGAVGLETLLSAGLRLVQAGQVSLPRLLAAMSTTPAALLGLRCGRLERGAPADLMLFDPEAPYILEKERLRFALQEHAFRRSEARRPRAQDLRCRAGSLRLRFGVESPSPDFPMFTASLMPSDLLSARLV